MRAAPVAAVARATAAPVARRAAPNEVFTPTRPRAGRRALVGRRGELAQAMSALTDEAAHVVVYSERGRGKTSLANLVVERLRRGGVIVARHACDASSDFDQIVHGLLRDLPGSLMPLDGDASGEERHDGCLGILPRRGLQPADIASIPSRLGCSKLVFVVDEFDRVRDEATRTRLADTIKMLSDRGDRLLFMIVGVSTTLEHILGQHPSIERNISALHLPLLDDGEIADMLLRGGEAAGIAFSDAACRSVAGVARGMPYMAQLMGLRITQNALMRGAATTSGDDVAGAIARLLDDAGAETAGRYAVLTAGPDGAGMAGYLYDIAAAPQDKWGRFALPRSLAGAPQETLKALLEACVLQPAPGVPGLFQTGDRKLMYHVLLLAAHQGVPDMAAPLAPVRPAPALRSVGGGNH